MAKYLKNMNIKFQTSYRLNLAYSFLLSLKQLANVDNIIFKGGASKHLTDKFDIDLTSPTKNVEIFRRVIKDCAHPEMRVLLKDGLIAVGRFIRACGVKGNPIYVYRTELDTYIRNSDKSAK